MLQNRTIFGEIQRRYRWKVNRFVISRSLKLAKEKLSGDQSKDYARVRDYVAALLEHNPGSIVVVHGDSISSPLRPILERFYVCLESCKIGLHKGCRLFIALDGYFLKRLDGG